jgi:hypothetical protein
LIHELLFSQGSNIDSGNGCSVIASPSSPSAMSMESLAEENPDNQALNSTNAKIPETIKEEV